MRRLLLSKEPNVLVHDLNGGSGASARHIRRRKSELAFSLWRLRLSSSKSSPRVFEVMPESEMRENEIASRRKAEIELKF
ncbi:hypothetical protein NL676_010267 [Syzygium grande]|nr:hypothetical protein NL676_010267 [Syzygium grande]